MRGGMAVRRRVTAPDMPAGETEAQMNPPIADPQAVFAPRDVPRERRHLDRVEMRADVSQVGVIPGVSYRAHPIRTCVVAVHGSPQICAKGWTPGLPAG